MLWVYAVCDRAAGAAAHGEGVDGVPLQQVTADDVLAVVSEHRGRPERTVAAAIRHAAVVERVAARGATLPCRLGTVLPDAGALRAALAARGEALTRNLALVRGRVELGVRATPTDPAPRAASRDDCVSGREYLLARRDVRRETERAGRAVDAALAPFAAGSRRLVPRAGEALRAAYLVERDDVPRFALAVERLNARPDTAVVLCTGPWPPYSFADLAGAT